MSAVLIILVIIGAVLGAVVGFFRKFTKTSFWGITVLFALLFERMIGTSVKKSSSAYGISVLLTAIIVLLALSGVLLILRKLLANAVEARKKLSEYKNFDDREETDALILNAVDNGDKREYRKQLRKRKKIKDSAGIWGVLDRIFGAVSGGINGVAGFGALVVFVLLFVDLSGISALQNAFSAPLSSASWKGLGTDIALDLLIICALSLSIRTGYRGGISSTVSFVVVLGLVVGFGFASWSIASSEACAGAVEGLKNGLLSSVSGTLGGMADGIAKIIIAGVIFLLSLIVIILVAVFLPKLVDKFRENKVFSAVDGVLGALFVCAVVTLALMAFGGIAYTLYDVAFMAKFTEYATHACVGDAIYACNPMGAAFSGLPFRSWFKD